MQDSIYLDDFPFNYEHCVGFIIDAYVNFTQICTLNIFPFPLKKKELLQLSKRAQIQSNLQINRYIKVVVTVILPLLLSQNKKNHTH